MSEGDDTGNDDDDNDITVCENGSVLACYPAVLIGQCCARFSVSWMRVRVTPACSSIKRLSQLWSP